MAQQSTIPNGATWTIITKEQLNTEDVPETFPFSEKEEETQYKWTEYCAWVDHATDETLCHLIAGKVDGRNNRRDWPSQAEIALYFNHFGGAGQFYVQQPGGVEIRADGATRRITYGQFWQRIVAVMNDQDAYDNVLTSTDPVICNRMEYARSNVQSVNLDDPLVYELLTRCVVLGYMTQAEAKYVLGIED